MGYRGFPPFAIRRFQGAAAGNDAALPQHVIIQIGQRVSALYILTWDILDSYCLILLDSLNYYFNLESDQILSNDPFDVSKAIGGTGSDIVKSVKTGIQIGRNFSSWRLKKRLQSEGYDPITIEAAVEAEKNGRDPAAILHQAHNAYALKEKQDTMRLSPPAVHGSARWATKQDLEAQDLLGSADGTGLSLGKHIDDDIVWHGESHLLTIAPTRTGKGIMQILPNLLQYKGSAVILDPKGELFEKTAVWRRKNVGPIYVLNPFNMPLLNGFTHAFNPLDQVTDSQSAVKLAETIYPRSHDQKQQFFDNEAIGFLAAVVEFVARFMTGEDRSFGAIRNSLSSLDKAFYDQLKAMAHPVMPDSIKNAANNFSTKSKETGKPRVLDSINQHLRIWDSEGLRKCTAQTDFDFRNLKDAPATVYLILPFEEIEPYSTFVRMVFATALDAMLANKTVPEIPVLFVLDEFLALDPDDRFVSALRTHASAGVRLWFFLQDLPTLEQKYPTTWKSFLQVETKTFFGTDDPFTAEMISKYLGDRTVAFDVPNMSASTTGGASGSASYSISENLNLTARNLLTPDEVIAYMAGDAYGRTAIHFMRNVRPVQATLTPWFSDPDLKDR